MAPGFELMGWLKQAGAQASSPADVGAQPAKAVAALGQAANAAAVSVPPSRITAPHSQAAAALAAALSSGGGVPEKKQPQPHGYAITPLQDVVEVDRIRPESASTLVVSKIANYPSEICRRHGHSIAVDTNYICYGLKSGQIRILNRHTAARTLLKDHAAPVTDLRFFRHDSERCLLASVDTTGQVHVRKVYEEDMDGDDAVRDEILARHELPIPTSGPAAHPPARLAWHPAYDFVLAVTAGPTVYFINVPPTADVAAAPEYSAPVAAARSKDGAVMTSVAFSPSGDLLAAGDARGFVYIWALTSEQLDPALVQPLAAVPDILFQAYDSGALEVTYSDGAVNSTAVVSLSWLPRGGKGGAGAESIGSGGGVAAPLVLLTGDSVNAHLKLWTVDLSTKPHCTHVIQLTSAAAGGATVAAAKAFFNHLEAQPLFDCVVLANELQNHVYVLHVDLTSHPASPKFDYISEFSVKMPILSCTLVPESFEDEATGTKAFHMYTIQSDAVQQYTLVPAQCFPMAPLPAVASAIAPGGSVASTAGSTAIQYAPIASSSGGGMSDAPPRPRLSNDLLASLLAFQQQQRQLLQQQQHHDTGRELPQIPADVSSPPQPPCALVAMPSDVSDATSPPTLPSGGGAPAGLEDLGVAAGIAVAAAGIPAREEVQAEEPKLQTVADADAAGAESLDAAVAAAAAEAATAAAQEADVLMQAAGAAEPQQPSPLRTSLLLTPSQLMHSAAAASVRSVASSCASMSVPGALNPTQDEGCGVAVTEKADAEIDTAASTAGTSRSQSLALLSHALTPSLSDANLAAVVASAAASGEMEAVAEGIAEAAAVRTDVEEADAGIAAPAVEALPTDITIATSLPPSISLPRPSDLLVQKAHQGTCSPTALYPNPLGKRLQLAAAHLTSPPASISAAAATVDDEEDQHGAAVSAAAALAPATTLLSLQAQHQQHQQALAQLKELQQQVLEQVSAGQRELLKVIRAEAQRSSKAAGDAAATRAAEAMARKAAEERRKEMAELQKALTGAINHMGKDLSQRVADAAAATTAAVKAAIGPAIRAAVAEALPAALSAGGTAAALERALGSQLGASLPRAVEVGLGMAFTDKVVPPLEKATANMFIQMEGVLRAGLVEHLAPLGPLATLGDQLCDAASQVQAAVELLKREARTAPLPQATSAAPQSAGAGAGKSPLSAPAPPPAPLASMMNAARGGTKTAALSPVGPSKSATSEVSTATSPALGSTATGPANPIRVAAPAAQRAQPSQKNTQLPNASATRSPEVAQAPVTTPPRAPAVTVTPAPAPSAVKEMVLGLIRAGDVDSALSRVLERQDLPLVLWACEEAGGAQILSAEPCPLAQPTLLSLLTFLSYDLTAEVDLKLGWIDAILKRLDVREPGLAPHIRSVLENVKGSLAGIARGGTGATAAKAKQAVHQAIGLISMLSWA
ncbi:hypothetical protein Vretimale_5000 [Volvox reticuliferus]|uniref:Uncharacterized protein n=1 Tax=Volvox reticuliferus TaxID=1737510 RepID=A0A8J4C280_9CHLO|nr:hypothetical protein Vretifemale_4107 [Volvox reticuliferus]GIL99958.1 hypothetical protein Vretimale_5000 [Volvox reticuliferus]